MKRHFKTKDNNLINYNVIKSIFANAFLISLKL